MKRCNAGCGESRGSTLVSVVILLGTMTVLALVFLRVGQRVTGEQLATVDATRANYLAEAGISEAVEALRSGQSGNVASGAAPAYLGGGILWVEATDLGGGRMQLDSMAMKDGARTALRVVVENAPGNGGGGDGGGAGGGDPFYSMFFSNQKLDLDQGIAIDSFDSTLGSYASQAVNTKDGFTYAGTAGSASSNADVSLGSDVHVFGDAHAGPGGSVSTSSGTYVSGSTTPNPAKVVLADVPVPVIPATGAYSVPTGQTKTINPGSYHFTGVTQGKSSKLKIIGPATLVMDGYTAGASATLELDCSAGQIKIYDTGKWVVNQNYLVGPAPGTPLDAAFLMSSDSLVRFNQGSVIHVGFYAPRATIQVDQGAEVWGALVGDRIDVNQNARFHFDESLRGFELPWDLPASILGEEQAGEVAILSWSEIEFPVAEFRWDRRDPFTLLGVDRNELRAPVEAWEDERDPYQ